MDKGRGVHEGKERRDSKMVKNAEDKG